MARDSVGSMMHRLWLAWRAFWSILRGGTVVVNAELGRPEGFIYIRHAHSFIADCVFVGEVKE
jgi:ribosomal protein RSM22 (predicted rRNA methylase)